MEKTYTLSDGTKFIFEYDHNRMGIITLECMDTLMSLLKATAEPQTDLLVTEYPQDGEVYLIGRDKTEAVVMAYDVYKELTEPQTEMEKSGSRAVQTARRLNCHNAKACKENHWEVCKYEPWKLTAVDDEPQIDCRRCKHYATDKCKECFGHELFTDSGYATDCSWQKGE